MRLSGGDPRKLRVVVNPWGTITATQVAGGHVNVGISSSGSAQAMSEDTIGKAMRSAEAKRFAETNNWTTELVGSKELPIELDKEYARLRAMLSELGMAK